MAYEAVRSIADHPVAAFTLDADGGREETVDAHRPDEWHPGDREQQQGHGAKPRRYVIRPMQAATAQPGHAKMHGEQQSDQPIAWRQRFSAWTRALPHQIWVDNQQRNHA